MSYVDPREHLYWDGTRWRVEGFRAATCESLSYVAQLIDPAEGYRLRRNAEGYEVDADGVPYYEWPAVMPGVEQIDAPANCPAVDGLLWRDRQGDIYYWGEDNLLHPWETETCVACGRPVSTDERMYGAEGPLCPDCAEEVEP